MSLVLFLFPVIFFHDFCSWLRLAKIRYFFSSSDVFCCWDDSNCKNTSSF